MNSHFLKLVSQPSVNSFELNDGIHFRWFFNNKIGFPLDGFEIFYRKSNLLKRRCFKFNQIQQRRASKKLVFENVQRTGTIIGKVLSANKFSFIKSNFQSVRHFRDEYFLLGKDKFKFELPFNTDLVEIRGVSNSEKIVELIGISNFDKYPYRLKLKKGEEFNIQIRGKDIEEIEFTNGEVLILEICVWICDNDRGWQQIDNKCYPPLPYQSNWLRKELLKINEIDELNGACQRLIGNISQNNYSDLKESFLKIDKEGHFLPWGWTQEISEIESFDPVSQATAIEDLRWSLYELITTYIFFPEFAKSYGNYISIEELDIGEYYDFKLIAKYTGEGNNFPLSNLEYKISAEDFIIQSNLVQFFIHRISNITIVFQSSRFRIKNSETNYFETTKTLTYSRDLFSNQSCTIRFSEQVGTVQLFLSQADGCIATIQAYNIENEEIDAKEFNRKMEVIQLVSSEDEKISHIEIKGQCIEIHRMHFSTEILNPTPKESSILCGVKYESKPNPISKPVNLEAYQLVSFPSIDSDTGKILKYRIGLTWNLTSYTELSFSNLNSSSIIGFQVRRKYKTRDENFIELPSLVLPSTNIDDLNQYDFLGNAIPHAIYKIDGLEEKGEYEYQIAAVDLWGRRSKWSDSAIIDVKPPLPAVPGITHAKYYDEIELFQDKQGLRVVWEWTESMQEKSFELNGFKIYFKDGFFNTIKGRINSFIENENSILLNTDLNILSVDKYAGEKLKLESQVFSIVSNTAGANSILTIEKFDRRLGGGYLFIQEGSFFSIVIQNLEGAALDRGRVENWDDLVETIQLNSLDGYDLIITETTKNGEQVEVYDLFIEDYNLPPITNQIHSQQIGITSFNTTGESHVSNPLTIICVDRVSPPTAELDYNKGEVLYATVKDYFNKSLFALRWTKEPDVSYDIYRAIDESIYLLDKQLREAGTRTSSSYDDICTLFGITGWDKRRFKDDNYPYKDYTPLMKQALANMPDLSGAYSKINETPLKYNDPLIQDKDTSTPIGAGDRANGDPNVCMYLDKSLEGNSNNFYFYKVKTLKVTGTTSGFSISTPPVQVPDTTIPKAPYIQLNAPSDATLKLKWQYQNPQVILRFDIYRSIEENLSRDYRLMELIHSIGNNNGEERFFEFFDENLDSEQVYYYRILAIKRVLDADPVFNSQQSNLVFSKPFDQRPPEESEWISLERTDNNGEEIIILRWSSIEKEFQIKRSIGGGTLINLTDWFEDFVQLGEHEFIDRTAKSTIEYKYQIIVRNKVGYTIKSQISNLI